MILKAPIRHLKEFNLGLGKSSPTLVIKNIEVARDDFFLDLLFYNRFQNKQRRLGVVM